MLRERVAEWNAEKVQEGVAIGLTQGLSEGFSQGLSEGLRQTIVAVASDRFGKAVARVVGAHIAETTDEEVLARVRRLVSTSKSGEEVLLHLKAV